MNYLPEKFGAIRDNRRSQLGERAVPKEKATLRVVTYNGGSPVAFVKQNHLRFTRREMAVALGVEPRQVTRYAAKAGITCLRQVWAKQSHDNRPEFAADPLRELRIWAHTWTDDHGQRLRHDVLGADRDMSAVKAALPDVTTHEEFREWLDAHPAKARRLLAIAEGVA